VRELRLKSERFQLRFLSTLLNACFVVQSLFNIVFSELSTKFEKERSAYSITFDSRISWSFMMVDVLELSESLLFSSDKWSSSLESSDSQETLLSSLSLSTKICRKASAAEYLAIFTLVGL
jgi:hypothetical protein